MGWLCWDGNHMNILDITWDNMVYNFRTVEEIEKIRWGKSFLYVDRTKVDDIIRQIDAVVSNKGIGLTVLRSWTNREKALTILDNAVYNELIIKDMEESDPPSTLFHVSGYHCPHLSTPLLSACNRKFLERYYGL